MFIKFEDPATGQVGLFRYDTLMYWVQGLTVVFYKWCRTLMPHMTQENQTLNFHRNDDGKWLVIETTKFILVLRSKDESSKTILEDLIGLLLN